MRSEETRAVWTGVRPGGHQHLVRRTDHPQVERAEHAACDVGHDLVTQAEPQLIGAGVQERHGQFGDRFGDRFGARFGDRHADRHARTLESGSSVPTLAS